MLFNMGYIMLMVMFSYIIYIYLMGYYGDLMGYNLNGDMFFNPMIAINDIFCHNGFGDDMHLNIHNH